MLDEPALCNGKHYGISVRNLIRSDIFNLFGVQGLAAILRDLPVDMGACPNLITLSLMVLVVLIFMRTGWIISRKEGAALISMGLAGFSAFRRNYYIQ